MIFLNVIQVLMPISVTCSMIWIMFLATKVIVLGDRYWVYENKRVVKMISIPLALLQAVVLFLMAVDFAVLAAR